MNHSGTLPTVLVVDDEPALRAFAEMILQDLGYSAVLAENGRAGVQKLLEDPDAVTAVLLDMTMPGLSAEDTFRMLREIRPDLPVVILSGELESSVRERFGEGTIAGYIQKPYTDDDLQAALSNSLAEPGPDRSASFQLVRLTDADLAQTRQEYLADLKLQLPGLQSLLKEGNFVALQGKGHSLKGSGGCFGFPELTEIGRSLEASARVSDAGSCQRQLSALVDGLNDYLPARTD